MTTPRRTERFAAAIAALKTEISYCEDCISIGHRRGMDPSYLEIYESDKAAIRLLEAAGKFTADDIERITNTLDDFIEYTPIARYKCPGRALKDKFIAFLKAIPAIPEKGAGE